MSLQMGFDRSPRSKLLVAASILAVTMLTPINSYYAAKLTANIDYIASIGQVLPCEELTRLRFLGWLLSIVFPLLGLASVTQALLSRRLSLSFSFLALNFLHLNFLTMLLILESGYCRGNGASYALQGLSGPILFGAVLAIIPVPLMLLQIAGRRKQG